MNTKSRQVIWGGRIMGAEIRAKSAREDARRAAKEADRAEAEAWSLRMEGYGGPAQPSPTIGQCLNGGFGRVGGENCPCKGRGGMPPGGFPRGAGKPVLKVGAPFPWWAFGKGRFKTPGWG